MTVGKAADWLREERRKTLGDWVESQGNPWFPHGPPPSSLATLRVSSGSGRAKPGSADEAFSLADDHG